MIFAELGVSKVIIMPTCCICYTTDPAYLFPTFVSAVQARHHASTEKADVIIFSFGSDPDAQNIFSRVCEAEGIQLITLPLEVIDGAAAMLARLFLNRFAPPQYDQFLYIDGDTQIRGSLDPLIEAPVPAGCFMAANDPMTFAIPGTSALSRDVAQHFAALGVQPDEIYSYFNTGVLRINRNGWEKIGLEAWDLFRNGASSRFPDQDVLNIVGNSSRIPMSLAWNFPIFMCNSGVEAAIMPRIYHFMSNPKPWQGVFPPWGVNAQTPYQTIVQRYPDLARYRSSMKTSVWFRYQLQQRYKKVVETFAWNWSPRRKRILSYEDGLPALASLERV
jgi:lipopolysaccharide biosynthesis glycosyltransferase